ncbi:MAG: hypothetical protein A3F11_10315 [Gammaproteobacteria bacterium RIFCSPHIGHO2_12_FULL_37_14]|nr:MAG: hypothetical protein A3F11_10315 [Gammaproteobacteria bacterium RIFCSPHIGHO2_12_FULL_37_14]
MDFLFGIIILIAAGTMNGSFALPTKYLKNWSFERIWLNFSIWTFLVFPCLFQTLLSPSSWKVITHTPASLLAIIIIGGFLFGIGQFCFALCLRMIGFSLGFVINIGIGTALGSLAPLVVLHYHSIFTSKGVMTIFSIALIIFGVALSYIAGLKRDQGQRNIILDNVVLHKGSKYVLGVFYAVFAGISSAIENFVFSLSTPMQQKALHSGISKIVSANMMWPLFLLAAFIPYAGYMLYLMHKNKAEVSVPNDRPAFYYLATVYMGAFWYSPIFLYSFASLKIGELGPVIGWPLFMVAIILASNAWGWKKGEWFYASSQAKRLSKVSMLTLVIAILILGVATVL